MAKKNMLTFIKNIKIKDLQKENVARRRRRMIYIYMYVCTHTHTHTAGPRVFGAI
jgi:hypothetical protein